LVRVEILDFGEALPGLKKKRKNNKQAQTTTTTTKL
jgi:hypothetical protein